MLSWAAGATAPSASVPSKTGSLGVEADATVGPEVKSRVEVLVEPYADVRGSAEWKAEGRRGHGQEGPTEALAAA